MNLTFTPKQIEFDEHPQEIVVDGNVVGEVKQWKSGTETKYHAIIRPRVLQFAACSLLQGFGSTPESAVLDAIYRARQDAAVLARATEEFAATIGATQDVAPKD